MIVWLIGALACSAGPPETLADCAALQSPTDRENCRLELASARLDDSAALRALIAQIPTPESRDLLRIRLAVLDPARAGGLCEDAETAPGTQRCQQVLGRPHLRSPRGE